MFTAHGYDHRTDEVLRESFDSLEDAKQHAREWIADHTENETTGGVCDESGYDVERYENVSGKAVHEAIY